MDRSSESDEESVRHDRFRSERFQAESRPRAEVKKRHSDDRNTQKRRERSPLRNHRRRHEAHSSPPSWRRERNNHERKSRERDSRDSRQKSSSGNSDEWVKFSKKISEKQKTDKDAPSRKKCLSSLLKSFDEKVDAKRQSESVVGPALPSHISIAGGSSVDRPDTDSSQNSHVVHPGSKERTVKDDDALEIPSEQSEDEINNPSSPLRPQENIDDKEAKMAILDGPALPHLLRKSKNVDNSVKFSDSPDSSGESAHSIEQSTSIEDDIMPAQPQEEKTEAYGPALAPKVQVDSYGPALPPGLKKSSVQGPTLPEGLRLEDVHEGTAEEEEDDEETVGPLPEGKMTAAQFKLELRAAQIKQQLEDEKYGSNKEVKQREEWMLELPSGKASNLGLGPRSFRKREAPDMSDRSSWTDTPTDRRRKEEMAARGETELIPEDSEEAMRLALVKERDAAMDEMTERSCKGDRPHSLLDMHQKKLNKKKKKQEKEEKEGNKKKERRPFDRNIDLQVNRFDEAQKKAIFKKAQLLDTRFSTGESKYL